MSEPGAARREYDRARQAFVTAQPMAAGRFLQAADAALAEAEAENKALRDEVSRLEDENRMLAKAVYQ